jgi:HEAT repeats
MNSVWARVFVSNKSLTAQRALTLGACFALCTPTTVIAETSLADWLSPVAIMANFSASLIAALAYSVAALALLCVAMAIATFVARIMRLNAETRKARFNQQWEPYLFARMAGENIPLPPLARRNRTLFLILWLRFHGYVKDDASDILTDLARELGLENFATRLMSGWRTSDRLVGLSAVALLSTPEAARRLPTIAGKPNARFAYIATCALLRSDPARGLEALRHALATRDWFPAAMAEMIRPHGAPALALVEAAVREADPLHTRRLVRLLEGLGDTAAMPILRERLPLATEGEEIAAIMHALGRMGSFDDRERVLAHNQDKSWLVRMECARALGRIGMEPDVIALATLARDSSWWVRYRAVGALLALAGEAALSARAQVEQDAYARNMMLHVLAEHTK